MISRSPVSRSFVRWGAVIFVLGAFSFGFVALRNGQVKTGERMRLVEEQIRELDREIEMYRARRARLMSQANLEAALEKKRSGLTDLSSVDLLRVRRELDQREEEQ
ncbi:MAG: hypothetical protein AAGJ31_02140 [Verrucomicrobiota bacterium]